MEVVLNDLDFSTSNATEYDTCDAFIGLANIMSVTEEPYIQQITENAADIQSESCLDL